MSHIYTLALKFFRILLSHHCYNRQLAMNTRTALTESTQHSRRSMVLNLTSFVQTSLLRHTNSSINNHLSGDKSRLISLVLSLDLFMKSQLTVHKKTIRTNNYFTPQLSRTQKFLRHHQQYTKDLTIYQQN